MNTSKPSVDPVDPQTPRPDEQSGELINPKPPDESDESTVSLVVHTVSGDVIRKVGRVEREMELEEETRQLCEKARQLMEEADQWGLRLWRSADMRRAGAEYEARRNGCINLGDSISFNREKSDIKRWQAGDGRLEFMGEALGKLLEALKTVRGRTSKEALALQDESVAKFSSLLNEYKRAHSEPSDAHHEYLVRFLEIACGFHPKEGLPVGLEKNAADGIITLMSNNDWESSMDKGMDLLELVCPFYSTSSTGQRMFAVIMGHLDRMMKMDLESVVLISSNYSISLPDSIKKEEKKLKDCYQKACNDVLRRNKLPEHKFKREGGGRFIY